MKTTIEIAPAILERGKRLARKERTTLRSLVDEGLRKVIEERERGHRFKLRRVPFVGGGFSEGVDPAWDRIQKVIYTGRGS